MLTRARYRHASNLTCGQSVDLDRFPGLKQANTRKRKDRSLNSLGTDFDTLLARGALYALVAAAAWAVVVATAVALEAVTQGRVRLAERAGCPRALRLWLLGVFVALLAGVAPAEASDQGAGPAIGPAITPALDGLPLPDRASGGAAPVVVVRPGDSLWRIARGVLPRDSADATVAATVARLYADNHHLIGPDPDLIRPGQQLTLPEET
jgi:nucleoid-associated protein YgaU